MGPGSVASLRRNNLIPRGNATQHDNVIPFPIAFKGKHPFLEPASRAKPVTVELLLEEALSCVVQGHLKGAKAKFIEAHRAVLEESVPQEIKMTKAASILFLAHLMFFEYHHRQEERADLLKDSFSPLFDSRGELRLGKAVLSEKDQKRMKKNVNRLQAKADEAKQKAIFFLEMQRGTYPDFNPGQISSQYILGFYDRLGHVKG